jgi:hypothetical protein
MLNGNLWYAHTIEVSVLKPWLVSIVVFLSTDKMRSDYERYVYPEKVYRFGLTRLCGICVLKGSLRETVEGTITQ